MWLWSKGLGRLVLPMDLGRSTVDVEQERLILRGQIIAPKVNWDCTTSLYEEDLKGFIGILGDRNVIRYLVKKEGIRFLGELLSLGWRFMFLYLRAESRKWSTRRKA